VDYSNPTLVKLRSIGQKLGILRPVARLFRSIFRISYENSFDAEMMRQIKEGETIWDVGANQGIYTKKFAEKVGKEGIVIAFEPFPSTFKSLQDSTANFENVTCLQIALASKVGKSGFNETDPNDDTINCLSDQEASGDVIVDVSTGDALVASKQLSVPNAMKIDVEGFEIDVIKGILSILKDANLRKIFVEVHFLELKKRGFENGAREMTEIIEGAGFDLNWTDPSHFIATRKTV
jgi:FkbM family methyltransferase